jgi:Glycosyl transferase family 2
MTPSITAVLFAGNEPEARALQEQIRRQRYPEQSLDMLVMLPAGLGVPSQPHVQVAARTGRRATDINQALAVSQADYLAFVDATLELDPGWLDAMVKEAHASWRVVGVAPKIYRQGRALAAVGAGIAPNLRWYDRGSSEEDQGQYDENREVFSLSLLGSLLDRNHVRTGPGLDQDFATTYADIDLSIRIVSAGYRLRFAPQAIVRRPLGSPGSDRNPSPPATAAEWERLLLIAKHYPDLLPREIALAAPMLAGTPDPKPLLQKLLDKWVATADPEARQRCLANIASDPVHLHEHLLAEWQLRTQGNP